MKTHLEIIQHYIDNIGAESYLEIGLFDGMNFANVKCENKTGVDPATTLRGGGNIPIFKMTSDEFFDIHVGPLKYDVIFVDGLHHRDQVDKDISNAICHLNEGGVILIHDVNPPNEICTRVPRETREWCGDVFRSWHGLVKNFPELKVDFHPQDYGMAVIHYSDNIRPVPGFASDISYEEYKKWLHEKGWA